MIRVGARKFITAKEAPKMVLLCFTCASKVIQLKYVSNTSQLQGIGWEERLQKDLFYVEWDVVP